jgi:hypothetical protein
MSAWTQLYNFGSAIIKRPAVWLLGVLGTVATGLITDSFTPVKTFLSDKAAELSCQFRQKPSSNESQFTILVSPLAHDPDRSNTERVMRAFLHETGFIAVPICESLNIDYSTNSRRRSFTSSEVAARAVSPASRFFPASRKSFDQR